MTISGIGGLGLGPDDPCYDQSHPWFYPNFMNTAAECQCMIDHPLDYTPGQQCVGYCTNDPTAPLGSQCATAAGVAAGILGPAGEVAGSTLSAAGAAFGQGAASAASGFAGSLDLSGLMLLALAGLAIYAFKR